MLTVDATTQASHSDGQKGGVMCDSNPSDWVDAAATNWDKEVESRFGALLDVLNS